MKSLPGIATACSMPRIRRRWRSRAATRPGTADNRELFPAPAGGSIFVQRFIAGQLPLPKIDDRLQSPFHATAHEHFVHAAARCRGDRRRDHRCNPHRCRHLAADGRTCVTIACRACALPQ